MSDAEVTVVGRGTWQPTPWHREFSGRAALNLPPLCGIEVCLLPSPPESVKLEFRRLEGGSMRSWERTVTREADNWSAVDLAEYVAVRAYEALEAPASGTQIGTHSANTRSLTDESSN